MKFHSSKFNDSSLNPSSMFSKTILLFHKSDLPPKSNNSFFPFIRPLWPNQSEIMNLKIEEWE